MEGELKKTRGSNNQDVKPIRIHEYDFFLIRDAEVTGKDEGGAKEKNEDRNKSVIFFLE